MLQLPISPLHPWLAPLAGHSDLPLRVLCREEGAAVTCTEMVSAKGLVYGARSRKNKSGTEDLLLTLPLEGFPAEEQADAPLVVQLFGEEASFLGEAVSMLLERGFKYFDLNLGCSVPKVVKTGAGAALTRNIDSTICAAKAMINAASAVNGTAVGFKIRLGWNQEEENYLELARALEDAGAAWLTLHPRYARQAFSGEANWSALAKLKKCLNIPLIASGDLFDAASAARCLSENGVDAVMFARGALNNPAIFREYLALMNGKEEHENACERALRLEKLILRHAELAQAMPDTPQRKKHGEERPTGSLLKMRGAIPRYIKDLPGSRSLRLALTQCKNWDEFYLLINEYFTDLRGNIADSGDK